MKNRLLLMAALTFNAWTAMAQSEYKISVDLQASKENVWEAITNFKAYPRWNSVLSMHDNDQLQIGRKFNVTIHLGKKDSKFRAEALSKEDYRTFSAQQTMLGKWFFSATHHFHLEDVGDGVRFVQRWQLTGIMSKLFKKQIFKQLALFNTMNEELKAYVGSREASRTAGLQDIEN